MVHYLIVDTRGQQQFTKRYLSRSRAQRVADALDMEFGAVRFIVRRIEA